MEVVDNLNRRYIRKSILTKETGGMEGYRARMIQGNTIPGLVRTDKRCLDGLVYFYYDVTGMQNLLGLQPVINTEFMDGVVRDLENLLQSLEDYLLKQQEICLLPENIWHDEENGKWYFVYIPEYGGEQKRDIGILLEFVMDHVDCEDEEGLERFYNFYSDALQRSELPDIGEIIRLWKKQEVRKDSLTKVEKREELSLDAGADSSTVELDFPVSKCEVHEGYKEKIYSVPFHGLKVSLCEDATLT